MNKLLTLLALGACLSFGAAQAQDKAPVPKAPTAQQNKMGTCNKDAGAKKGDDRKAFMKECLSAAPAKPITQQEKMKNCNAEAKTKALSGDPRKAFMKECLSSKA
ncbi:PsiF family protein [Variovorax ginsengisoli]|uniref:Phosphate starvation-inducible protein PsiF n=1 Tax=Variovorax ginsengisoli TaxID=363844 RepID=A0ABT9S9I7_9BURK|nr:PsiF family protein [Variovorax ginsengisoli]MDP9900406.1 hypothetical protein [Variovorax ginsengisoli]